MFRRRESMLTSFLRVKDWLHGICQEAPEKRMLKTLDSKSLTEAERLRIAHMLITNPQDEGGAGITPEEGEWHDVDAVFPLHDHKFNKEWLKEWSTKYILSIEDLTKIRNHYGEKAGFSVALEPHNHGTFTELRRRSHSTLRSFSPTLPFSFSRQFLVHSRTLFSRPSPSSLHSPIAFGLSFLWNIGHGKSST
jgi:hypothetical protein